MSLTVLLRSVKPFPRWPLCATDKSRMMLWSSASMYYFHLLGPRRKTDAAEVPFRRIGKSTKASRRPFASSCVSCNCIERASVFWALNHDQEDASSSSYLTEIGWRMTMVHSRWFWLLSCVNPFKKRNIGHAWIWQTLNFHLSESGQQLHLLS